MVESDERKVNFEWAVRRSELEETSNGLLAKGALLESEARSFVPPTIEQDDYSHSAFEPMLVIVGVVAVSFLIERIVNIIKDVKHSGLIIDARSDTLIVREQPSLNRGTAIVLLPDGKVEEVDGSSQIDIASVLSELLKGGVVK